MRTDTPRDVQYAVVDLSTDSTTVYGGPCIVVGASVQVALSAHACPIKDGATTVFSLPASAAVGTWYDFGKARFVTSLVVDPDDVGTGTIAIMYVPDHDGKVA
jgi:hypothetical protein